MAAGTPSTAIAAYDPSCARTCDKPPCPALGCAHRPAATATCRDGRCEAVSDLGL